MPEDKYAPQKIDIKRIQAGLSMKQMLKIQYECNLLQIDTQKLLYIAPHMFNEGITASNTVYEEKVEEVEQTVEEPATEIEPPDQNSIDEHYYLEEDDYA